MSKSAFQIFLIALALFATYMILKHDSEYEFANHSEITKETLKR